MSKRPSTAERDPSATDSGDADPFLSRWARRKAAVRRGGDSDAAAGEPSGAGDTPPASMEAVPEGGEAQTPELTDEDMPPVESIDEHTDMSAFFSSKVSQAVRKAALRKFFHSPAFNVVDGLDDYDDDFRSFQALGDIITSDMRGQMDRAAEGDRESAPTTKADSEAPAPQQARSGQVDEQADEQADQQATSGESLASAEDDAGPQPAAHAEAGVTREPGVQARIRHGKLRPKGAADDDG
jgi:hypothetical protein